MSPLKTSFAEVSGIEVSAEGCAVGTVGGRAVRIDYAIPGETVEVRMRDESADEVLEVVRVVRPSPHRVAPRCPFFGPCGGCKWQHIDYAEQLRLKERLLERLLSRSLGAVAPAVRPMLSGGEPWAFRNKVHFVFAPAPEGLVLGHYRRGSQQVVEVDQCPVHAAEGNRVAFALRDALARERIDGATPDGRRGLARHVVVRATEQPRESLATLVVTRNDKRLRPAVRALLESPGAPNGFAVNVHDERGPYLFGAQTLHLHGRARAREEVAGTSFLISPTSFFQTNVRAADAMVRFALEQAGTARTAVDVYAGTGLFALPLARRGARVVAIEENPQAVEDGEASRRLNGIDQAACTFVRARAESVASGKVRLRLGAPDVVVLDPPRTGCPRPVLDWICRTLGPPTVIYVSCNPEALVADLPLPLGSGYSIHVVQPVDMFPHTPHIEAVVVLRK